VKVDLSDVVDGYNGVDDGGMQQNAKRADQRVGKV